MSVSRVSEIFIGAGAALSANDTALPSIAVQTGIVGTDMLTLNPNGADTITTQPSIYIVNKLANGDFKRSVKIDGTSVIGYKGLSYSPARRNVWGIGYHRASVAVQSPTGSALTAGGSIVVANSTLYTYTIRFKNDKQFYSERPEVLSLQFTSAAAATQSNIADQIVSGINNSAFGSSVSGVKEIIAVKIGDGTGAYGLTGATNFGVEITGLTINQFQSSTYQEELVYFSVQVDDATGFGTTDVQEVSTMDPGNGTYNQIYNKENFYFGYEGVLNRTLWPVPTLSYLSLAAGYQSGAFTLTAATVTGEDEVTFSASIATQLFAGQSVTLDAVTYEIKYVKSTTVVVLTSPATTTNATGAVTAKAFYDVINITVRDLTIQDGAGVGQFSIKNVVIATPAIIAGATGNTVMSTASAEGQDLMDILNGWMTTTPAAFANISI